LSYPASAFVDYTIRNEESKQEKDGMKSDRGSMKKMAYAGKNLAFGRKV